MVWDKIILNIFVVNNNMRYDLIIRNITLLFTVFTISVFGGKSVAYAQRPLYKADTLTIKVFGDVMMHKAQIDAAHKGWGKYFTYIEDEIKNADLAVANMEFTLAGEPYSGYPAFSAPDDFAEHIAKCGFDIFLCANNHIYDKGSAGTARTLRIYKELGNKYGIRYTGLTESSEEREENLSLTVIRKGMKISFINMTYGTNLGATDHWPKVLYQSEKEKISNALSKAETESDITIALPHWGTEYELLHSESQAVTAEWLINEGADLIIGTHPHVAQDLGRINGVEVAYSLGNLVSNMSAANTQLGLMATIKIVRHPNGDVSLLPLELTYLWCSRPGGLTNSYTVIPIEDFIGRRDLWLNDWDYEKMVTTYERVRKTHNNNEH